MQDVRYDGSLADALNTFDPFNFHADFGFILTNDDRMSAWFSDNECI